MIKKILSISIVRYIAAGLVAYSLELGCLIMLNKLLGVSVGHATAMAFWVGLFTSFFLQKVFAFQDYKRTIKSITGQLGAYLALIIFNYIFVLWIVSLFSSDQIIFSRTLALVITTFWNFVIYKYVLFNRNEQTDSVNYRSLGKIITRKTILLWGVVLASAVTILSITSLGIYIRPMSDDLMFLGAKTQLSLIDFMQFSNSANGRVSSSILYFLGYSTPGFLYFVPVIGILLVGTGIVMLVKALLQKHNITKSPLVFGAISLFILATTLLTQSGLYSSLFWFASAPVHTWSYGLFLIYVGFVLGFKKKTDRISLSFMFPFILLPLFTGLLNETTAVMIILMNVCLLIYYKNRKNVPQFSLAMRWGLYMGILSLIILYFAPGSIDRRTALNNRAGHEPFLQRVVDLPSDIAKDLFTQIPLSTPNKTMFLLLLFFSLIIGLIYIRKSISSRQLLQFSILLLICTVGAHILNISILFIMTSRPIAPLRMYFLTSLCISIFAAGIGLLIGLYVRQYSAFTKGIIFGMIISATTLILWDQPYAQYLLDLRGTLLTRALHSDIRDQHIKKELASDRCIIKVERLGLLGVDDIYQHKDSSINIMLYRYHSQSKEYPYTGFLHDFRPDACGIIAPPIDIDR